MTDMPDETVVELLKRRLFDGIGPASLETITTHISLLLLGGQRVLKLKRPVRLNYVDFSTPQRRLSACERELELNRRTAPQIYTGVHRVTRQHDGTLCLDGSGELVDAAVSMRRFEEASLLDRQALAGSLTPALIEQLASVVARFHRSLPPVERTGGADRMGRVLGVNEAAFAASDFFGRAAQQELARCFRAALADLAPLLDARAKAGFVRRGHGDLHLRNICLVEGEPVLFDCLEFSEELGTTDVLYDLAFLLMDLWHRGLHERANELMNRYLDATGDEAGLPALPFFMAVRAAVRAHVGATGARSDGSTAAGQGAEARRYFDLAGDLLRPRQPVLIAVGGLSGSGKSTVAAALAAGVGPPPGARTISSDRLRKQLQGVSALTRLPADAYRREMTQAVYRRLERDAAGILGNGHAVVADATFERPEDRRGIEAVARDSGTPFLGLWLDVPAEELLRRVGMRMHDPSDATAEVVRRQLERDHGDVAWTRVSGEGEPQAVGERVRRIVTAAALPPVDVGLSSR